MSLKSLSKIIDISYKDCHKIIHYQNLNTEVVVLSLTPAAILVWQPAQAPVSLSPSPVSVFIFPPALAPFW